MRLLKLISLGIIATLLLTACDRQAENPQLVRVGTVSGPDVELLETAKQVAKDEYGLEVKIVEFGDYSMPNTALNDGSVDVNVFQHLPYLQEASKARGYDLAVIGKTFIFPMGIYSEKITGLEQLQAGSVVAIPNDPTNEARALRLLESAGLIELRQTDSNVLTEHDITANPKKLRFKALNAASLPRALPDVAIAVINNNYALPAGLNPANDALVLEDKDSAYANIIVVRADDINKPQLLQFVAAMHSEPVKQVADKLFQGQAVVAW